MTTINEIKQKVANSILEEYFIPQQFKLAQRLTNSKYFGISMKNVSFKPDSYFSSSSLEFNGFTKKHYDNNIGRSYFLKDIQKKVLFTPTIFKQNSKNDFYFEAEFNPFESDRKRSIAFNIMNIPEGENASIEQHYDIDSDKNKQNIANIIIDKYFVEEQFTLAQKLLSNKFVTEADHFLGRFGNYRNKEPAPEVIIAADVDGIYLQDQALKYYDNSIEMALVRELQKQMPNTPSNANRYCSNSIILTYDVNPVIEHFNAENEVDRKQVKMYCNLVGVGGKK